MWALTSRMIKKSGFKKKFISNLIALAIILGLILAFLLSIVNISVFEASYESSKLFYKYFPFALISAALLYFLFISLSLPHYDLKSIFGRALNIGIKKAHCIIPVYLINIFLIILFLSAMFYFIEVSFLITLLMMVLFVFSFVFGRVFLSEIVYNLDRNE
jgi:predicted lysophospholipase L1 biosynthesis ABC-type transport system permease subunit